MSNERNALAIVVGDVIEFRKPHPCGAKTWTVTGLGADIRLRCDGCGRRIMMPRRTLEKRMRRFVQRGPNYEAIMQVIEDASDDSPT